MGSGIKKAASKKKVRVAAAFTGTAACAFAFAPTAAAAAGTAGTQPGVAPAGHQTLTAGKTHHIRPDGTYGPCGDGTAHWLHLAYYSPPLSNEDACVGGITPSGGAFLKPPPVILKYCGGNNSGVIYGSGTRRHRSIAFGHGNYYATISSAPFKVNRVKISAYSGSDTCGIPY
jgi:hypothetical protein